MRTSELAAKNYGIAFWKSHLHVTPSVRGRNIARKYSISNGCTEEKQCDIAIITITVDNHLRRSVEYQMSTFEAIIRCNTLHNNIYGNSSQVYSAFTWLC